MKKKFERMKADLAVIQEKEAQKISWDEVNIRSYPMQNE